MKDFFEIVFFLIGLLLCLMLLTLGIILSINGCNYYLDKSMCKAHVAEDLVYQGRCHFLSVSAIGENRITKKLVIYKDKIGLKPIKVFINDDIKITDFQEGIFYEQ